MRPGITLNYEYPLDEEGFRTESFEYEADGMEVRKFLEERVYEDMDPEDYGGLLALRDYVFERQDELMEEYKTSLLEHFEDKAMEYHRENRERRKNPDKFYGVSRKD